MAFADYDLVILYGTQTGNAQRVAEDICDKACHQYSLNATVEDMMNIDPSQIVTASNLVIVTSTYGDGEPPDNAYECFEWLKYCDQDLSHIHYAVLGLGDTYYPHFCQCGKDFDSFLSSAGAKPLIDRLDCDLYFEEHYPEWANELLEKLNR